MEYVELGTTGERISALCLGTMMFGERCDEAESDRILSLAVEHGVNFIDTAAMYANGLTEEILGRLLKHRRDRLFITTKVHKGIDAASIAGSIEESLSRLQTDYVDLYLIHWPQEGMQPAEVMEALARVVGSGKARYVGCCNYPAWLLAHSNAIAARNGWPALVCNQLPYNLVERGIEVEILPQAAAEHIAITVYRPLLMGLLAGKYRPGEPLPTDSRGTTDSRIGHWLEKYGESIRKFDEFAAALDLHPSQLAIAWVQHSPGVTASIVGASSADQLGSTLRAFDVHLTDDQYQAITHLFDTEVKEEAGGKFPSLRRLIGLSHSV